MNTIHLQATTQTVDGEKFFGLHYTPENQKCPNIVTSVAKMLIYSGFDIKVYHSTPQDVQQVNHVEVEIYVDDAEDAAASFELGYVIGKSIDGKITVTGAAVTFTLIQWNASMDFVLDDTIVCNSAAS